MPTKPDAKWLVPAPKLAAVFGIGIAAIAAAGAYLAHHFYPGFWDSLRERG